MANYTRLGEIRVMAGDAEGGADLIRRSAAMAADLDWDWWRAGCLTLLAHLALDGGDVDEAERNAGEALTLARQDESPQRVLSALTALARIALARGGARRAGLLWAAVEAESARAPSRAWESIRSQRAGPLLDDMDPAFLTGVEDGRRLEVWVAVAIALGEEELPQTVP